MPEELLNDGFVRGLPKGPASGPLLSHFKTRDELEKFLADYSKESSRFVPTVIDILF